MFWLTLLPICGGIGASVALQGSILAPYLSGDATSSTLRSFRSWTLRLPDGGCRHSLIQANTKKVGHAASIVGSTVIARS
ncbi:PTS system mannose/fructose/sorbose family transporter subunit IID [Shigella flexneri]